jgi:hypothetical protein
MDYIVPWNIVMPYSIILLYMLLPPLPTKTHFINPHMEGEAGCPVPLFLL